MILALIIAQFPALRADCFPALIGSHPGGIKIRSLLLEGERLISISVAHLAVLAPSAQRDALLRAPLLHLATFAMVVEYGFLIDAAISNAAGESVEAK